MRNFTRFPGGVHVTERPHEEQGTFGPPSDKKMTSEATIWPHSEPLPAARNDLTQERRAKAHRMESCRGPRVLRILPAPERTVQEAQEGGRAPSGIMVWLFKRQLVEK